jgi:hypothetical protein
MSTDLFYSNNPADAVALEGITVSKTQADVPVTGVALNTVALVGQQVMGPDGAKVRTSPQSFSAMYGGRDAGGGGAITGQLWKAINNRAFSWPMVFSRARAAAAVKATANLVNGASTIAVVTAASAGAWANGASGYGLTLDVVAATDGDATHWNLVVKLAGNTVQVIQNINTSTGFDNTLAATGSSEANLITLAKGGTSGRPTNITGEALASGSDGTIAASDYVTALDAAANMVEADIVVVCERAVDATGQATLNAEMVRLAAANPQKLFVTWGGAYAIPGDDVTAKNTQFTAGSSDFVIYCGNTSWTYDKLANSQVEGGAHLDMAAILSQTAADIHPGDEDNLGMCAGVRHLTNESLQRGDLISLKGAGISTLEKVDGGFRFHTAVTTTGLEITDVRTAQYLMASIINSVKHDVRKPFTATRSKNMVGKIMNFLQAQQKEERFVDKDSATMGKAFDIRFVQTDEERSRNLGKLQIKIRTIPHLLYLVLLQDIGTGVITFQSMSK